MVKKSGGFSPYAYLEGATLIRKIHTVLDKEQLKLLEQINEKESFTKINTSINEFKIGIDLVEIMKQENENSELDLILKGGDVLIIPSKKQTVEIRGEVLVPSLIRFDTSSSLKEYIHRSGGFSENAKRNKVFVIHANGDVKSTKNFMFFKSYPKIKPGSLIVVPNRKKRNKMSTQEVVGITTGLATLGLLINMLIK